MEGSDVALAMQSFLDFHPCFSYEAHFKFGRLHLPVASKCNIKCNYCDRRVRECYHVYRPAVASGIISPRQALAKVSKYKEEGWLKVVGIAGPGEPLYNRETFETLKLIHELYPDLILCLSTNGLLLPRYIYRLAKLGLKTCTVTINAVEPKVGARIYSYINYDGRRLRGFEGAEVLIRSQLDGIVKAVQEGIIVKVNTVLIPGVNEGHMLKIAKEVRRRGAYIQNIMPLIPLARFSHLRPPSCYELRKARARCERIIPQFRLCKQCRADSVGIPAYENRFMKLRKHG